MGDWNKTCGLSKLPISESDEVYIFILEKNTLEERSYNSALWSPFLFPFEAKYDGFGGAIDTTENQSVQYLLNSLFESKYNIEDFYNLINENKLRLNTALSKHPTYIDMVMIRKDVVEKVLNKDRTTIFIGFDEHDKDKDPYHTFCFDDIKNSIPELTSRFIDFYIEKNHKNLLTIFYDSLVDTIDLLHKETKNNKWKSLYSVIIPHRSKICFLEQKLTFFIKDLFENDSDYKNKLEDLLSSFFLGLFIDCYIDKVRLLWTPACHEGRTEYDLDDHILYHEIISDVANNQKNKEDSW